VSVAQAIFSNVLIKSVPPEVLAFGATELQNHFKGGSLEAVRAAYMDGLSAVFLLALLFAGVSIPLSFLSPWVSIKGKANDESEQTRGRV
jgi:hypothetical protein